MAPETWKRKLAHEDSPAARAQFERFSSKQPERNGNIRRIKLNDPLNASPGWRHLGFANGTLLATQRYLCLTLCVYHNWKLAL